MMRLTIIGFGNQARAWAQNLKDSRFPVRIALRGKSASYNQATSLGLDTVEIGSEEFYKTNILLYSFLISSMQIFFNSTVTNLNRARLFYMPMVTLF